MKKTYVEVSYETMANGAIRPVKVYWHDGRCWEVTRTLHMCASVNGEYEGIRYTILIGSAEKYIYRTDCQWYVVSDL